MLLCRIILAQNLPGVEIVENFEKTLGKLLRICFYGFNLNFCGWKINFQYHITSRIQFV